MRNMLVVCIVTIFAWNHEVSYVPVEQTCDSIADFVVLAMNWFKIG